MGVFDLFRSEGFDPEAYERELTALNKEINSVLVQKRRIKQQRRLVIVRVESTLIIVYLLIMYYNYLTAPATVGKNFIQRFVRSQSRYQLLFYVVVPVVGYLLVQAIYGLYTFLYKKKEKQLDTLQKKLKKKIEDLKKITNFETTNNLLNKYGTLVGATSTGVVNSATEAKNRKKSPPKPTKAGVEQKKPVNSLPVDPKQAPPNPQAAPQTRAVSDRLLDILIGSENNELVEDRYALICRNCYTHNGLAPPGSKDPFSVVYLCPRCGFLNGEKTSIEKSIKEDIREGIKEDVKEDSNVIEESVPETMATESVETDGTIPPTESNKSTE